MTSRISETTLKRKIFLIPGILLSLAGSYAAQSVPPPPKPHIETDLRDNTTKIRAIELERVKRQAQKAQTGTSPRTEESRFSETKNHFEKVQKLQDSIIRTYTTGEKIDYGRIAKLAASMTNSAVWLDESLFGGANKENEKRRNRSKKKRKTVRDLIIDLDKAIQEFVTSPIFSDTRTVNSKESKRAKAKLAVLIELSTSLSGTAKSLQ